VPYDQQDILFTWVGWWATKISACSRSRRAEEEKGTVRTVLCLLGSCLPLGWTLVPFRLRLEWYLGLANSCFHIDRLVSILQALSVFVYTLGGFTINTNQSRTSSHSIVHLCCGSAFQVEQWGGRRRLLAR